MQLVTTGNINGAFLAFEVTYLVLDMRLDTILVLLTTQRSTLPLVVIIMAT